jgi:hypothetical protein
MVKKVYYISLSISPFNDQLQPAYNRHAGLTPEYLIFAPFHEVGSIKQSACYNDNRATIVPN